MKKWVIVLLFLIGTFGFSDFEVDISNEEDYCIGIGKLNYERVPYSGGYNTFRASLCRIGDNVVRNVKVYYQVWEVWDDDGYNGYINNYDVRDKLVFYTKDRESEGHALYDSQYNLVWIFKGQSGPAGVVIPIDEAEIDIYDEDLEAVYGTSEI